jgi:polysaccharide export outer membrane protein
MTLQRGLQALAIYLLKHDRDLSPMRRNYQIGFTLSIALCLAASAGWAQNVATGGLEPSPAPDSGAGNVAVSPPLNGTSQFVLGPSDVIHVNVWKNVELSQTVTVGPDGFVSLPLLGDVHVAGMTANQLGLSLAGRLSTYVVSPQVTVSVVDIRSRQVYVLGQVGKPGGFPLIAPINVLQLIAQAGGLSTYANRKGIVILRPTLRGMQKISFNYNNVVHGEGKQNIDLQPGDTVVVP